MRYMIDGRTTTLMRLALGLTLLLLAAFWVATALLYFTRMDLGPESVVRYYRGAEEEFLMPRTYGSMIETTHMHLGMMAVVLLLLTHLTIFVPWPTPVRIALVIGTFATAIAGESAGWLVRFVSPAWAPLKIVGFVGLEVCLLVLFAGLGGLILRDWRYGRAGRTGAGGVAAPYGARPPAAWSTATIVPANGDRSTVAPPTEEATVDDPSGSPPARS